MNTGTLEEQQTGAASGAEPTDKAAELRAISNEAAGKNSRINIPLNLANWRLLAPETQDTLLWFHQHLLDNGMGQKEAEEAIGYEWTTIFRVLKGTYEGSWPKVCRAIDGYRRTTEERAGIQQAEFVENRMTRLIFGGLSYALANNSITTIVGESRMGKTTSAKVWQSRNNHGRSVFVTAPVYGSTRALLREIARAVGVNRDSNTYDLHESVLRAFNRNRILIVDEAHRLLPTANKKNPVNLEILRDLHDRTGCGLALLSTARFDQELRKGEYQFEQLVGRIGMPIRLHRQFEAEDVAVILKQYVKNPGAKLMDAAIQTANRPGRLGLLIETLKVASKLAAKDKQAMRDEHVFKALGYREQMGGERLWAQK